jgi:ferric-dicitrate binding protein FerR (iron transport regulator)
MQQHPTSRSVRLPKWLTLFSELPSQHIRRAGLGVFHNESVVTAEASASRVIFRDDSQLSIGPTSWVNLDDFVYNPNPTATAVSISLLKGVFRFVGGTTSRENFNITTPAVSVGLRGTAFTVYIMQNGSEYISVESGTIYVTCHRGVTVAVNAGQMTYIASPQGSPTQAQLATPIPAVAQMDALLH